MYAELCEYSTEIGNNKILNVKSRFKTKLISDFICTFLGHDDLHTFTIYNLLYKFL